jgi:hypothetical protein
LAASHDTSFHLGEGFPNRFSMAYSCQSRHAHLASSTIAHTGSAISRHWSKNPIVHMSTSIMVSSSRLLLRSLSR